MNPWSGAETEKSSEAFERELFARRARALEPAVVPSLASVLRAAEVTREKRAAQGARGRALVAMALAAACMMAALTRLPQLATTESIVAELDATPPAQPIAAGAAIAVHTAEAAPAGECEMARAANEEALASEERACFAPTPLFTPAPLFSAVPATRSCGAEESCVLPAP